jgi:hypothetical protein
MDFRTSSGGPIISAERKLASLVREVLDPELSPLLRPNLLCHYGVQSGNELLHGVLLGSTYQLGRVNTTTI